MPQESLANEGQEPPGPSVLGPDFDRSFVDNINNLLRQTAQRFRNEGADTTESQQSETNESQQTTETEASNSTSSIGTDGIGTSNGAIIITVNYVFSDENDPANPNRTGSLVLTLPNNPANRDPRTIEELIRFVTQMAYSAIINGRHHQKGLSLEKFESFPVKKLDEITSHECAICLENFIDVNHPDALKDLERKKESPRKKRKLNDTSLINSDSQTDEANDTDNTNGEPRENDRSKLLASAGIEFPHTPVQLPCAHIFGQSCLSEWLKNHTTCPLCRTEIANPRTGAESADNREQQTNHNLDFTAGLNNETSSTGETNEASSNNSESTNRESPFTNFRLVGPNGFDEFLNLLNTRQSPRPSGETRSHRTLTEMLGRAGRTSDTNTREPSSTPSVFSNILTYFRRRQPEGHGLFPMGVSSRRTNDGVVSSNIEANSGLGRRPGTPGAPRLAGPQDLAENRSEEVLDFLNLRSLTDDARGTPNNTSTNTNTNTSNEPSTNTSTNASNEPSTNEPSTNTSNEPSTNASTDPETNTPDTHSNN